MQLPMEVFVIHQFESHKVNDIQMSPNEQFMVVAAKRNEINATDIVIFDTRALKVCVFFFYFLCFNVVSQ